MNDRSDKPQPSLRDIFLEAVEIEDASARAAFLDAACRVDPALRRHVEQLLAAEEAAGPPSARARDSSCPGGETLGTRVGRYKLLQQFAELEKAILYFRGNDQESGSLIRRLVRAKA